MKPEKMQALLLKIRKGNSSGMKMPELVQVMDYLGGYKLEEVLTLRPEHWEDAGKPEKKTYSADSKATVEAMWEKAKADEHTSLPTNLQKYKTYYQDIGPILENPSGKPYFQAFAWQAVPGVRITAPNHKVYQTTLDHDAFLRSYPQGELIKWLRTETPYLSQVDEKLGVEPLEVEKARKVKENLKNRMTENMGTCPCCFGGFKLVPRSNHGHDKSRPGMVLHGYKRPGTGTIYGNCFGQGWPPFELSREGADAFVSDLKKKIANQEDHLKDLKSGQVLVVYDQRGKAYSPGDTNWEKVLKLAIGQTEALLSNLEFMLKTCERQLVGWEPRPLP